MAGDRETGRITAVVARTALCVLTGLCLASGQWAGARAAAAQQCAEDDECNVQYTCQDGVCKGTPRQDGTACRVDDPCGTSSCQSGTCLVQQLPPDGTPCDDGLAFTQNDTCFGGFCFGIPDIGECEDDGNECTIEYFNTVTQQCDKFVLTCEVKDECSTWQCNPANGTCESTGQKPNNTACDDHNVCTSNDRCQAGACAGSAVVVTPTGTETPTATRSQTATPSRTATATATPTPSTTPPQPPACGTDCGGDGKVTVDDIVRLVNNACPALPNRTQADLILAVSGALDTCAEEVPNG